MTKEDLPTEFGVILPEHTEHPNPFGDQEGETFTITGDFDLTQFANELREETKNDKVHAVLSFADGSDEPSKENPAKLFVNGVDREVIKSVLDKHEPTEEVVDPKEAAKKIKKGEAVTHDELLAVVKTLL